MAERKENNIRQRVLLLLYAGFFLLLFYSCYYADFYETGLEGVRFWDILFEGKIHHFYSQVFLIGNMQYVPLYDFPMYIIFALWNFPLWVVEKCTGIDIYHSVLCLMWMKSMLLFWLLLFQKAFGGVIELVVDGSRNRLSEMRNRGEMLFLTSTFTVTGIAVLGQYDIITMTLMMLGLKAYLQGDKKWFTIWFALAAPLKYFSLLIYAPLVLMDEKRIRRILVQAFSVILPMVFFWIAVPYGRAELLPGCTFSGSSEGTNVAKPIYDALFVHGSVDLHFCRDGFSDFLLCISEKERGQSYPHNHLSVSDGICNSVYGSLFASLLVDFDVALYDPGYSRGSGEVLSEPDGRNADDGGHGGGTDHVFRMVLLQQYCGAVLLEISASEGNRGIR